MPTAYGEIVLRLLDTANVEVDLGSWASSRGTTSVSGYLPQALRGHLVTGPTGSGKSTTLYATLKELNSSEKNIITVEDPVEYKIPGLNQVQVNPRVGLSFASGLRNILRADPDIVMIGEIRDKDTAKISVEAALTGHLVLATLHTNDAPGALSRLTDMGVEPYLTSSAVDCVIAQACQEALRAVQGARRDRTRDPGRDGVPVRIGLGCVALPQGRGLPPVRRERLPGRMGIYELMEISDEIRKMILLRSSAVRSAASPRARGWCA